MHGQHRATCLTWFKSARPPVKHMIKCITFQVTHGWSTAPLVSSKALDQHPLTKHQVGFIAQGLLHRRQEQVPQGVQWALCSGGLCVELGVKELGDATERSVRQRSEAIGRHTPTAAKQHVHLPKVRGHRLLMLLHRVLADVRIEEVVTEV